jgi:signal transduction histidine kinase
MPRKQRTSKSGHTILVVDDQEETRTSTRRLLEREGHTVLVAESGEQALALFRERPVTLVLVDYFMPRMTGAQVVRQMRTLSPYVQIILLTGYSGEKPPRVMLAELDIQGYHDKADGPEKLLLWVDVALKAHHAIHALQERERVKHELIANVSHEFRTPVNTIGGYTALLLDGEFGSLPKEAQEVLRSMNDAANNLGELVVDFLDYTKLEARANDLVRQRIPIAELAAELGRMAALLLEGRPIEFQVGLEDAPVAVLSDSVKLRTILRNLITNAAKFTTAGRITLRVKQTSAALCFAVQDTGPGIRAEDLSLVFEPFRQLSAAHGRNGFGLGLALSRKLARILGGDLEVDSQPGVGSVFTLVLPSMLPAGGETTALPAERAWPAEPALPIGA